MNYVNYENMQELFDGIARKIGTGGSGAGLEDWQPSHEYIEKDICVYEGQIYRAKVGFTSDTTFSTIQILEEYTPVGGETIIPYEKDTEISIDDIVSYDNNTYKALYNFVCGEEFSLYALEEYVPQELTDVQEAEIINHFLPNIYSGGNMSVEDSTPIGTVIAYMGTTAPDNYLECDGTVYNISDYSELAEEIKTQFGSYNYFGGDGITTFAVPNMTPTNPDVLYCIKYQMSITNAEEIKDLTAEDIKQIVNSYNPVFEEAKGIEYSTEERRIGTWIDGKPLYEKTLQILIGTLTADQWKNLTTLSNVGLNNINFSSPVIIQLLGYDIYGMGNGWVCTPQWTTNSPTQSYAIATARGFGGIRIDTNGISVISTTDLPSSQIASDNYMFLKVQYTKTTD